MKAIIPCLFITLLDVIGPMGCHTGSIHPSFPAVDTAWEVSYDSGATYTAVTEYGTCHIVPANGGTYYIRNTENPDVCLLNIHQEWGDSLKSYTTTSQHTDSLSIPGRCTATVRGNMACIQFLPTNTTTYSYYIEFITPHSTNPYTFGFIQQGK